MSRRPMKSKGRICGTILLLCVLFAVRGEARPLRLYVSPEGNDAWTGRRAQPVPGRPDGPFATLEAARDAIRALKRAHLFPHDGVTVRLLGLFSREKTFELTEEDGGTAAGPVTYSDGWLIGGRAVKTWKPVVDPTILNRLDSAARGHVVQADLKAQGVTDYGAMTRRGFGLPIVPAGLELFFRGEPMPLARWPNEGWAKITGVPVGQNGGRFTYEGDRPSRWTHAEDAWLHGYWTYDWADSYEKIAAIDPAKHEIATVAPHGAYGYTSGKRFYVLNVLEELDAPGEWYLDRRTGLLYFWLPEPIVKEDYPIVSLLSSPLVRMRNASHVTLRELHLEASRGSGVEIEGGEDDAVVGCKLENLGTRAVVVTGGRRHKVVDCDISETGDGGVQLEGGDRKTLTPCGHVADNNEIHDFSRWSRTYRPAIGIDGVGIRAVHNTIYNGPHNAILLGGNDHLIEYNDISHVCTETGDAGAIYMGRNLTMRGTVIRYNYLHDLTRSVAGGGFVDVMAVYLDDCWCGTEIYGNLFVRASRAILVGGGRDNAIDNNIFIDCTPAIHVDQRGTGWANSWFDGRDPFLMDGLKAVPYDQPPYSSRYPHLAQILKDEPAKAKYNRILHNIRVGGGWIEWLDGLGPPTVEVRDNWTEGDPGFVAPDRGDFRLRPNAPARKLGFRPLPKKIGSHRGQGIEP